MLSKSHEPDWLYLFKWVPNKTLILKLEWKSKTNLSITVTIKATDHLRYLRICPDEIMVAILSRSHGVIYPLPTSVKQNVNKSVLFAQVIY